MNFSAAFSAVGEAIASSITRNLSTIGFILIGSILFLGLLILVMRYIEMARAEDELAQLQDWNMELHDRWREKAWGWRFELHKRSCRRCRGDLFGQLDFVLPRRVKAHTLQELRDLKAKQKAEAKAS